MYETNDAEIHADDCYPRESCGLIVDGKYVACDNIHDDPENNFEIAAEDYLKYVKTNNVNAVVHSHPDGLAHPTYEDMEGQERSDVPWCILPKGKPPVWFGDGVEIPDFVGRQFKHGVTDCYSLIRDWYNIELGITLPIGPRDFKWWDKDQDLYLENFEDAGFRQIDLLDSKIGDVFLASIMSDKVNHGAIFLGNNIILHHLVNRLSVREPFTRWHRYFTICLRYGK